MKYFAYGSNMDSFQLKKRKITILKKVPGSLNGYSLNFNKIATNNPKEGYANIVPDKNEVVEGVLYEIPRSDLPILDRYEGYPEHYDRIVEEIRFGFGLQKVKAVIYIAQPTKVRKGLYPSREYLNHLLVAGDFLSKSYYMKLESQKTLD